MENRGSKHLEIIFCFFLLNNNGSSKSNYNNKEKEDTPLLTPNPLLFYARSGHQHLNHSFNSTQQQKIKTKFSRSNLKGRRLMA